MATETTGTIDWTPVHQALRDGDIVMALEMFDTLTRQGHEPPRELTVEIAAAHVSRGNDLARRNLWDLALGRYRRARRMDPENGEATYRMGAAFAEMGATGAALDCLREAQSLLRRRQADQFTRHHLADACFQEGLLLQAKGNLRGARAALRRALKVKPDYQAVRESLDQLLPRMPGEGLSEPAVEREVLSGILGSISASSPDRRREALAALRDFPEYPEARAAASRLSDADPDCDVRFEARRTLGALPRPAEEPVAPATPEGQAGVESLARQLQSQDPSVRRAALAEAGRAPAPEMAAILSARLQVEEDAYALAQTVGLLARTGTAAHAAALEPLLAHPSCRVVANTVEAITQLAGELPLGLLLPLLESGDNRVRANALMSAVGARRPPVLGHLARMSSSDKESMRASALYCLERIDDPRIEELVIDMLRRESSPELLWKLAKLLARIATRQSVPALEELRGAGGEQLSYAVYVLQALADR